MPPVKHTVGPVWNGGKKGEPALLANAYRNSLQLAINHKVKTIAFPNISTGVYRYPKKEAAKVAIITALECTAGSTGIEEIFFVCYEDENYALYMQMVNV